MKVKVMDREKLNLIKAIYDKKLNFGVKFFTEDGKLKAVYSDGEKGVLLTIEAEIEEEGEFLADDRIIDSIIRAGSDVLIQAEGNKLKIRGAGRYTITVPDLYVAEVKDFDKGINRELIRWNSDKEAKFWLGLLKLIGQFAAKDDSRMLRCLHFAKYDEGAGIFATDGSFMALYNYPFEGDNFHTSISTDSLNVLMKIMSFYVEGRFGVTDDGLFLLESGEDKAIFALYAGSEINVFSFKNRDSENPALAVLEPDDFAVFKVTKPFFSKIVEVLKPTVRDDTTLPVVFCSPKDDSDSLIAKRYFVLDEPMIEAEVTVYYEEVISERDLDKISCKEDKYSKPISVMPFAKFLQPFKDNAEFEFLMPIEATFSRLRTNINGNDLELYATIINK